MSTPGNRGQQAQVGFEKGMKRQHQSAGRLTESSRIVHPDEKYDLIGCSFRELAPAPIDTSSAAGQHSMRYDQQPTPIYRNDHALNNGESCIVSSPRSVVDRSFVATFFTF
jgi:hypothetical protein